MTREERIALLMKRQNTSDTPTKTYSYQIPRDVPVYKVRDGRNLIDIIPYRITNKDNPAIRQGFGIGDPDYWQHLQRHINIGPNKNEYLCEARMFGKSCAICDAQQTLWDINDKENAKKLYPKEHGVYNVIDLLEPEKGIQVWRVSTFWVEDSLSKLAAMKSKGSEPIIYGDHEIGWSIEFYGMEQEKKFNNKTIYKPENFNFIKREEQYTDEIMEKAYPLDQYYNRVDYETVEADYLGVEVEKPVVTKEEIEKVSTVAEVAEVKEVVKEEPKADNTRRQRRQKKTETDVNLCPLGFKWGECDEHDECTKCVDADYDKCADIQDGNA